MKNKILVAAVGLASILAAHQALAVPFSSYDPRSFAMGGVGVAAGTSANAVFFNPALLATANEDEDFSFDLFGGARVADPDNFVDAIDTFNTNASMQGLSDAIAAYSGDSVPVQNAADQLVADLTAISNKPMQLELDGGVVIGVPSKKFGVSVYGNVWAVGGAKATVSQADLDAIAAVVANLPADPTGSFTSSVSARFATITETGVAIARSFNGIAVGVTPKYVSVQTNNYEFVGTAIDNADINQSDGEKTGTGFDLDVGVAKDFGNNWKAGVTIKNLLGQEYDLAGTTEKLAIDPMARAGVVHQNSWSTVALDVDLTENDPGGFDTKTQFAAVGIEFDAFNFAQIRLGARHNLSDTPYDADILSAGIGLSPFGVHLDISVAGNADDVGGALQLGFRF